MKKIFLLFIIVNCFSNLKAQFVTIPDPNFVFWLQANVPSAMNGNQMDTTSLAVTTRTIVDVSFNQITNLNGIRYFKILKKLICDNNQLTTIPNLPNTLEILVCGYNEFTSLPTLPNSLKILSCNVSFAGIHLTSLLSLPNQLDSLEIDGHLLASLPILPTSLKKLSCVWNSLTALPTLPNSLLYLDCSRNQLTTLPTLPSSLLKLICKQNSLSNGLPVLPSTLIELNCENNAMPNLPVLPNSLISISCGACQLNSLPTLPQSLVYLDCQVNNITIFPALPNSLQILHCPQNHLISLPPLPNLLFRLSCSYNNITSLPPFPNSLVILDFSHNSVAVIDSLPKYINLLDCSYNLIDSLPYLPNSLGTLLIGHNNITQINFLPNGIYSFNCAYNQLTTLPNLPPFLESFGCDHNSITCLPSLPSRITGLSILNNPFSCLPNYIPYMNGATLAYPLCTNSNTVTNPNNCNSFEGIEGFTFNDIDSNCIKGFNQGLINIPVKLYDSANNLLGQTISFGSGNYNFALPTGNYNVIIDTMYRPYSIICNNPGIDTLINLTPVNKRVSNVNFPINCKLGFDIGIQSIVTNGLVFPGQTHTLTVMAGDMYRWYNMNCAYGISGTLTFTVNGPVTYVGPSVGTLTPSVTGNIFTYNISNFSTLNNSASFQLVFQTDTTAQAGDLICLNANITPTVGDNDINNNTYQDCYNVINSYDPNIKEVYPVDVPPGFNDWLTYTIHFQNTGNAPALNIRLLDTLDNMLNLETFQVTNYSHYNQTSLTGNILNVSFPNIQLPDSSSNPSGSIGFIEYRIKPKSTWAAPYKIKNTANIYFDYNAPIVTNTTYNSIVIDIGIRELYEKSTVIYPNPNNGTFTLELNNKEKVSIQLIDITENIVLSQTIENGKGTIDASHLAAGVYNINIKGTTTVINKKVVIVK